MSTAIHPIPELNTRNAVYKKSGRIHSSNFTQKLFDLFGKEQLETELNNFLSQEFFPRCGGGIGLTRMTRAM